MSKRQSKKRWDGGAIAAHKLEERRKRSPVLRGWCKGCGRPFNYFFGPQQWWEKWKKEGADSVELKLFLEVENAGLCTHCSPDGHKGLLEAIERPAPKEKSMRPMQTPSREQVQEAMPKMRQGKAV